MSKVGYVLLAAITLFVILGLGVYNRILDTDDNLKASWSEVVNQYQRRSDLIPDLVSTIKGFAQHENEVITSVIEARANVTSVQVTPETLNNPVVFENFSKAQDQLSSALSRLMVSVERYPRLKSDLNFVALQRQLEATENRLTIARKRYIQGVKEFNLMVRKFPGNIIAEISGFSVKANFNVENESEIAKPSAVNFNQVPSNH